MMRRPSSDRPTPKSEAISAVEPRADERLAAMTYGPRLHFSGAAAMVASFVEQQLRVWMHRCGLRDQVRALAIRAMFRCK